MADRAVPDLPPAPVRESPGWGPLILTDRDAEALFTDGVWRYVNVRAWQRRDGTMCCSLDFYGDHTRPAQAGGGWYVYDPERVRQLPPPPTAPTT